MERPNPNPDQGEVNPDPRRTREPDKEGDDRQNPRRDQRPDQTPKTG